MKRLTPAFLTLIMFGVVGLLVAAYVAKSLLARTDAPAPAATRTLPMANADIKPGTLITASHVGQGFYPTNRLEPDMLLADRMVVGRIAKDLIKAAAPIRANMLYPPGEMPELEIADGMRAVTVNIGDSVGMVDGLIKPGNHVDVLFTAGSAGVNDAQLQGGLTMRLFEGVKILAINRSLMQGRPDRDGNRVTLELTEPQANILVLAQDRGDITLTFNPRNERGNGGLALNDKDRVTLYDILGLKAREPGKDPFMTEMYRGVGRGTLFFDEKGRLLDGTNGGSAVNGGRYGFDYRGYLGAPNGGGGNSGMAPGGYLNNGQGGWVLPNGAGASAPNGGAPPSAQQGEAPSPTADRSAPFSSEPYGGRSAPTASRLIVTPN